MHELSIAEAMVGAIRERVGEARIARVFLQIGKLACVEPDAIRFCFELCAQGTGVEGAGLEIEEVAARARCAACGADGVPVDGPVPFCPCGSPDLTLLDGQQLVLTAVELA